MPYPTPDAAAGITVCRVLRHDAAYSEEINHHIGLLEHADWWVNEGGLSVAKVQADMRPMIDDLRAGGCTVYGQVIASAAETVPDGWLVCDGQSYPEDQYPELAVALGAAWNTGSMFSVPDLRGRVVVGIGGVLDGGLSVAMGDTGGQRQRTMTVSEMPAHDHSYIPSAINPDIEGPGVPDIGATVLGPPALTGTAGGNQPQEHTQPYLALTWLIYAGEAAY